MRRYVYIRRPPPPKKLNRLCNPNMNINIIKKSPTVALALKIHILVNHILTRSLFIFNPIQLFNIPIEMLIYIKRKKICQLPNRYALTNPSSFVGT